MQGQPLLQEEVEKDEYTLWIISNLRSGRNL
jgi:hypothetical protein